jgi:2-polyprenyl-3-methyl-5-hydroxy-6-metoxy-1,4-benzoquinol methylase
MRLSNRATLAEVVEATQLRHPMIANGLLNPRSDLAHHAQFALKYLAALPSCRDGLDHAVEAFAQTSFEFLRLQARFLQTGRYARTSASDLVDELYDDDEEMNGYYLDGLAMTYVLWPNHVSLLDLLVTSFVPELAPECSLLEIGPGHGLLGHAVLANVEGIEYTALDISRPALEYVNHAYEAWGHAKRTLVNGDATDLADVSIPTGVDAIICCEVLEHVDDPLSILEAIRERLAIDGLAFVSTVANLEALDHVYLYTDLDHIRRHIHEAGLEIVEDRPMRLPGDASHELIPYNYAAILRLA